MTFDLALYDNATDAVSSWLRDYFQNLDAKPVRSAAAPGDIAAMLPAHAPGMGERFEDILSDFDKMAQVGVTHWNHPRFFAYFPCSTSPIALAADQLASALSQQGMLWQTSPLSTELEGRVVEWMAQLLGLDGQGFSGVINDTASTSTFSAVAMARERATGFKARDRGLGHCPSLRVYVSPEAHSSIKKAVWLAGIGTENVIEIGTGPDDKMSLSALREQIAGDRAAGLLPAMIVGAAGGTSVGAFDDLQALADVAQDEGLYYHIDAAWAGVAAIEPSYRPMFAGWQRADSIVLNPHKWLMTGMECSLFLVKNPDLLTQTMSIMPSYLQTHRDEQLINYSEWTPQLGRGFRSLKLWFVLRHFGGLGLAAILKNHVEWARALCQRLALVPGIDIVTQPRLSLFSFAMGDEASTSELLKRINDDGRIYLTQTHYRGRLVIRFVAGTATCRREDIDCAYDTIVSLLVD